MTNKDLTLTNIVIYPSWIHHPKAIKQCLKKKKEELESKSSKNLEKKDGEPKKRER